MMYLALTYDHRLLDGREAVVFLVKVGFALTGGFLRKIDLVHRSKNSLKIRGGCFLAEVRLSPHWTIDYLSKW